MKSKYETHVLPYFQQIKDWVRDGGNDKEIAKRLGIAYSSFNKYKVIHSEFAEILARTKEVVDSEMVNAFYRRAKGYDADEYEEEYRYIYKLDGTVEKRLVMSKHRTRHIPGDPQAMEFWLTHRQQMQWGKVEEAVDDNTGGIVMISERNIVEPPEGGDNG